MTTTTKKAGPITSAIVVTGESPPEKLQMARVRVASAILQGLAREYEDKTSIKMSKACDKLIMTLMYAENATNPKVAAKLLQKVDLYVNGLNQCLDDSYRDIKKQLQAKSKKQQTNKLTEIYQDLVALEHQWPTAYDLAAKRLSVCVGPIVIQGLDLGRFRIDFNYERMPDRYTIIPLEINEAQSLEHPHPHMQNTRLCEGEATSMLASALNDGRILDCVEVIERTLNTYQQSAAYKPLGYNIPMCSICMKRIKGPVNCTNCHSLICAECAPTAIITCGCGTKICTNCQKGCLCCSSATCGKNSCALVKCPKCGFQACGKCVTKCSCGAATRCLNCHLTCEDCSAHICEKCRIICQSCGTWICKKCSFGTQNLCKSCYHEQEEPEEANGCGESAELEHSDSASEQPPKRKRVRTAKKRIRTDRSTATVGQ